MTKKNAGYSEGGISLSGMLFIAFLVLKLTHVIDWSWWWITAPLWGWIAIIALFATIVVFIEAFEKIIR